MIPTAVSLVKQYPNILVTQTLSKSRSLAGLRVGFAIGQPELVEALTRVKDSFNSYPLDRLALVGASAAMDDEAHFEATRRQVIASREALTAELGALGFEVLPSAANFVFARHPGHDAAGLAAALRERSIIVRRLQGGAHRPVPAHHGGHRRPVRAAGRGAAGDPRLNRPNTPKSRTRRGAAFCRLRGGQPDDSALQAHLGRAGVGLQAFAMGQHRRDLAEGLGTGLGDVDEAGRASGSRTPPAGCEKRALRMVGSTWLGPAQ